MNPAPLDVEILFLDVGQGHATLIIDHQIARAILVDCPAGAESVVLAALETTNALLETGIITHFDRDHSTGVITLLENGRLPLIVVDLAGTQGESDLRQYRSIVNGCKKHGAGVAEAGSGHLGRISWRRIGPTVATQLSGSVAGKRNRLSLCLLFEIRSSPGDDTTRRLLVAGDADHVAWKAMLDDDVVPRCDFLLWPHHGGRLGTRDDDGLTDHVLRRVQPALVVISAGSRNGYRHPWPGTVAAVSSSGARLACTQATTHCHAAIATHDDTSCAGSVSVRIDGSGATSTEPDVTTHRRVIAGWDTPLCATIGGPHHRAPPSNGPPAR